VSTIPIVEAKGLTKNFGSHTAVDHLNFKVEEGEVFGLLGPNGAGKTTTIRMLACLISPSEGSAMVSGHKIDENPLAVRQTVGILTENPSLYERLTAQENMDFFAEAYDLSEPQEKSSRIKELLEFFDLWERRNDISNLVKTGLLDRCCRSSNKYYILHKKKQLLHGEKVTITHMGG
jgi:ABC-2 type transport system ATP-binding protein